MEVRAKEERIASLPEEPRAVARFTYDKTIAKGREEGRREGLQEGMRRGVQVSRKQIALNRIRQPDMSDEQIVQMVDPEVARIAELRREEGKG